MLTDALLSDMAAVAAGDSLCHRCADCDGHASVMLTEMADAHRVQPRLWLLLSIMGDVNSEYKSPVKCIPLLFACIVGAVSGRVCE